MNWLKHRQSDQQSWREKSPGAIGIKRAQLRLLTLVLLCISSFGLASGLGNLALAQWTSPVTNSQVTGSQVTAPTDKVELAFNTASPASINPYEVAPPIETEPLTAASSLAQTLPADINPYDIAPPLESEVTPLDLDPAPGLPSPQAPSPAPAWTSPAPIPPPVLAPIPAPSPQADWITTPQVPNSLPRTTTFPTQSPNPAPTPARAPAPVNIPVTAPPAPPTARPATTTTLPTTAPAAEGKAIKVILPPANIKPSPTMAKPVPQRPKFPPLPRQEVRGVWMTTSDMDVLLDRDRLKTAMGQLAKLNFNTVYPVVWNSAYALHPSQVARRVGSPRIYRGAQNQDPLREIIAQGHRYGLSIMPWFEFGFMVPQSSELAQAHPNWLTQKRNGELTSKSAGGENAWLNPFHPEVKKFLTDLVMEVVNQYDIDGIQFDDHMALPRDFGYDRYTKALYQQETGKAPPSNAADAAWMRWRADKITEFIGDLHDAVKTKKPRTVFSVSPNYHAFAYKFSLQDWLNWVRKDFVDEIVMQVYRDDYNSYVENLDRAEIREVKQKISTGIGILSGLPRRQISMTQIEQQSRAAHQRGLGVAYFFYKSLWDDAPESEAERTQRFAKLFPRPASRLAQLARF